MTQGREVRSVYTDQDELLSLSFALHGIDRVGVDFTYGNGKFYSSLPPPVHKFDLDPQSEDVVRACSTNVPLPSRSQSSAVFDPPFLTYVRDGRNGNGDMLMSRRFGGYWTYGELEKHYRGTLAEANRVLQRDGVLVFKCQDIVHNHRLHCTHANVIEWAKEYGFRLLDLYILAATHRLPRPNRAGKQKHARIFHSYFLFFVKAKEFSGESELGI